ncbi:slc35b2 [Symbiodinium necroappetens]|uniref:Slc35b2 protein n=1 Tax=Symbiodinium necroappetens TaxID=1628268 RepID=A0A813AL08_9DINO|nr:slc35b2 [Symbiodinium necroappetens]
MEGQVSTTSAAWCAFYGAGIIGTLVLYGILQEGIMTVSYDGSLFTYSVFLVLCNRLAAVLFAASMAFVKGERMQNEAPIWKYLIVSLSNVYASSCQYEALKYVSFAVQMLGKSFKMMPVMIWGIIISGKTYGMRDWSVALAVTLGCTEFLMTGPMHSKVSSANSFKGFLLLGGFLALDGLTSTFQEKLFKEHKTTKYNQMLYINLLSATVSLATLLARRLETELRAVCRECLCSCSTTVRQPPCAAAIFLSSTDNPPGWLLFHLCRLQSKASRWSFIPGLLQPSFSDLGEIEASG